MTNALKDIFQAIPSEIVPWPMFDDEIVWTLEEQGHISLKSSYKLIYNIPNQQLQLTSAIWFKGCIKKYSVCAWMFLRESSKQRISFLKKLWTVTLAVSFVIAHGSQLPIL